eukprot:GHVN01050331.1.p1 GENE.GHVN01050331.1~~GHVN01050331.1.p1  ORF type:complete len:429 (+),score=76.18 GHVN01050331.1:50-1288(+)
MPSRDFFSAVEAAPPDVVFSVEMAFRADTDPRKVNLGVGAYRTEEGKPHVFKVVRDVEKKIVNEEALDKEYTTIDGKAELKALTQAIVFGDGCTAAKEKRVISLQSLSGTGALKIAGDFLHRCCPEINTVYLSDPTWGNHHQIFKSCGMSILQYPYWNEEKRNLNFPAMIASLKNAKSGQAIVLHTVAHNPTGIDPTKEQWQQILDVVIEMQLLPILDTAYQGFASGDLEADGYAIRLFEKSGINMIVCQSFAKIMGLYGERIGMLHMVCRTPEEAAKVMSQVKICCRMNYSTPPIHGAHLLHRVLSSEENRKMWKEELTSLAKRLNNVRGRLRTEIEKLGTPGDWSHIDSQIGMFSYTGLTPDQCKAMADRHHIYMLSSGRISLAGANNSNVAYIAKAMDDVVRNVKSAKI